jgi:hypothetical protein
MDTEPVVSKLNAVLGEILSSEKTVTLIEEP